MNARLKVEPISGFPEWLPDLCLVEQRMLKAIREQYELYGFTPMATPAVERMEVLKAKGGVERQIYSVGKPEESPDDASLGLRFDLTVPLARYVAQHSEQLVFPFRRYQIQKVWRGERAQRGRFREFYQCDVDVIGRGSLDLIHDAEMPCVINSTFEALGLPDFCVHISNRKVLFDLLTATGCRPDQQEEVLRLIDKYGREAPEKTRAALDEQANASEVVSPVMELIECKEIGEARKVLEKANAPLSGLDELETVVESAVALGMPEKRLKSDFTVARGLDYYTGTVYETFVTGNESWGSVCSGGRYDDLAGYFTELKLPGVGISIGLTRLIHLLVGGEHVEVGVKTPTQVLVTTQDKDRYLTDYLRLARTLRSAGISAEIFLDLAPLREQMGYASSKGIPFAVIAGSEEFSENVLSVRDLGRRAQERVAADAIVNYLRERLQGRQARGGISSAG